MFFLYHSSSINQFIRFRTKWKRQTAVGLELLAEAGNYAAFQRLYGGPPYIGGWPYSAAAAAGQNGPAPSAADLYYRQVAAATALQKPLPYRLYPGMPTLGIGGLGPGPSAPFPHLSASNSLSSLSNYYQNSANNNGNGVNGTGINSSTNGTSSDDHSPRRTPSPPLNPGSPPPRRADSIPPSDDDSTIHV